MEGIPLHTQRLVERLLQDYCGRICPPSARNTVLLRFELAWDRATIHELQSLFGIPGTGQPVPVALFWGRINGKSLCAGAARAVAAPTATSAMARCCGSRSPRTTSRARAQFGA